MTSNRQSNKTKKRIKKWPFFVFVPVGLINIFIVFCLIMGLVVDPLVTKNELSEIETDFDKWSKNGFCLYLENGGDYLHFPNGDCGHFFDRIDDNSNYFLILVAASKEELLFVKRYKHSNTITDIIKTDWSIGDKQTTLLTLHDGDYQSLLTEDWKVFLWDIIGKKAFTVEVNLKNETYTRACMEPNECKNYLDLVTTYGSFYKSENGFTAKLPNGNLVFLNSDSINQELLNLFKKWNFEPLYSRRLQDNTIACVFSRTPPMGIGQKARFLIRIDYDGSIIANQFLIIQSDWSKGEELFPIFEKLPERIVQI